MKDFSLSLLSRGCGHVVQTEVDSQGGRIEVCFEPEDYFTWKSSQPVLRLSDSGRIRCGVEPAPPKTYSTRRGPLLLYSADMALPGKPEDASKKRRGCQHSVQEVELQLRTLRDLTGAVLTYDKKQDNSNLDDAQPFLPLSPGAPVVPPITQLSHTWHPPTSPTDPKKPTGVIHDHSNDQPVAPNPSPCDCEDETGFLLHQRPYMVPQVPLPPIPEDIVKNWGDTHLMPAENQRITQTDLEGHKKTKQLCLSILVDLPRVQMSPVPELGRRDWILNARNTGDQQEGQVQHDVTGFPGHLGTHEKFSAPGAGEVGERPCPLKTAFVDSSWSSSRLSRVTYYGGHLSGTRLGANCVLDQKVGAAPDSYRFSTLHLPPVPSGSLLKSRPLIWSGPDKGCTGPVSQMKPVGAQGLGKQGGTIRLPPLCDSYISPDYTHPQSPGSPTLRPPQNSEGPHHCRPQRDLHRKMLLLPPLLEHEFGQDKEIAETGRTNRVSSPTPAIQPKNRVSSPTPAIQPKNRVSSPTPAIQPKGLNLDGLELLERGKGGCHDTKDADRKLGFCEEFGQDKEIAKTGRTNRVSSPTPAIQPKNRVSSPTPAIQPKGLNLDGLELLERGKEDIPPQGVLPPLGGRKGPGKQSSMALFRQDPLDPHDCCDPDNLQTVVRGTLPVELRDWQKTNAVGTVVMGPDGEIIQLSFWGSAADTSDQQLLDDITTGRVLNASEVMQGSEQPWTLLLQTNTGTLVSDSFGHQAHMNQSALNKQDGVGRKLYHGQQGAEESQGLYPLSEEQCSLPMRPREMAPDSAFTHHTTNRQGEDGMEGTWDLQPGPLGWRQRNLQGLSSEEAPGTDPSISVLSGEGNTTGAFLSNKQSAEATAGGAFLSNEQSDETTIRAILSNKQSAEATAGAFLSNKQSAEATAAASSGWRGQSSEKLDKTSVAVNTKEARRNRRNRAEQQEEADIRNTKEAEGEGPFGDTLSEQTGTSNLGKSKAKGLKEKPQNVSSSQARKKRKGKQRAPFVVGNVRENALERLAEERMDGAGVRKKLDGVISDGVVKDKDPGQRSGTSSTMLGGSLNGGDPSGVKLNTPVSQSNRVLGSGRLSSSELLNDSACCDLPDTPTASRMKSQSSVASMMRGQSRTASTMNSQSPAVSMMKSQSPAFSMMKSQSPTVSLTDSQLALKVARERQTSDMGHVNLNKNSNTVQDGSRREGVAHKERQGAGRAVRAEQRRMEVERKRAEKEEQRKIQHEKEEREERLKQDLQKEQEKRIEEFRLKKVQEQEEHQQQMEYEKEQMRKAQTEREKEKRRQEEKKRQMERFLKIRQEEEEHKAAELERLRMEEEKRMEEERRRLQEMEEDERQAYLLQRQKEEEQRREEAEERKKKEGEAAIARQEAMLQLARQRAAEEQRLKFQRALKEEAEALELAQSVSRPWVYSYYSLLKILGIQDLPVAPEDPQ